MNRLHLILLAAALSATTLVSAQTTYRWVDQASGQTVYADQPPPPGTPGVVKVGGEAREAAPQVPYATRQAAEKYPVTLYTAASCTDACTQARDLLNQRGVPFIQIPTTLLSMVDSSVGGKVAVNHPEGKNMIGAFYQPKAVVCDLNALRTLPPQEYLAGLAEIVKYGVIYDEDFFRYMEENVEKIKAQDVQVLTRLIHRSCEIKAEVVGIDEKETGLRAILNYGHTFGHAIENLNHYEFSHGIGVSLGMRVAGRLSTLTKRWTEAEEARQAFSCPLQIALP